MPGFGLDFELANMTTIRESRLWRREMAALGKTGLDTRRLTRRVEGGARHLFNADAPISTGDGEYAVGKFDIGLGGLEQMRGDAPAFGDQLVGGVRERGAADRQRARAAGAAAERDRRSVALQHPDP